MTWDREHRGHQWLYRLSMAVVIAGVVTFGGLGVYVLAPRTLLQISQPMPVAPQVVRAGSVIALTVHYTKSSEFDSLVGAMIASEGTVMLLPAMLSALPAGRHQIKLLLPIPAGLPPGRYVLYLIGEHSARAPIPILAAQPLLAVSEPFTVVADGPAPE